MGVGPTLLILTFLGLAAWLFFIYFVIYVFTMRVPKDDHPVCRNCEYDLIGSRTLPTSCPECGADLTKPGSIVYGNRDPMVKRRVSIFVLILALTLVGIAILVA